MCVCVCHPYSRRGAAVDGRQPVPVPLHRGVLSVHPASAVRLVSSGRTASLLRGRRCSYPPAGLPLLSGRPLLRPHPAPTLRPTGDALGPSCWVVAMVTSQRGARVGSPGNGFVQQRHSLNPPLLLRPLAECASCVRRAAAERPGAMLEREEEVRWEEETDVCSGKKARVWESQ